MPSKPSRPNSSRAPLTANLGGPQAIKI